MKRSFYKISKKIHKYVGLICLFWFLLMGVSGVLINHPALIRGISIPTPFVPTGFHYKNWNRMAIKEVVYSKKRANTLFVAGRMGVWQSNDGGRTFSPMDTGYPLSAFDRDTNCLLLTRHNGKKTLYAGNRSGLFFWNFRTRQWTQITHKDVNNMGIKDIVLIHGTPVVFTSRGCFGIDPSNQDPTLSPMPLKLDTRPLQTVPMVIGMLRIHDGSILGLPGKLFVDVLGVGLIFLTISAIWLWYLPWRRKRLYKRTMDAYLYRWMHKYHLKLGIYTSLFLLVLTLTGMIIRPPFRHPIDNKTIPSTWVKFDEFSGNQYPEIRRALYLEKDNCLLLATKVGFFMGAADFSKPFTLTPMGIPVSGMGVNVLESLSGDQILVGSFNGLYIKNLISGAVTDAIKENNPTMLNFKKRRKNRAVGAGIKKGELLFWVDYRQGIIPVGLEAKSITMPKAQNFNNQMSLWHFMRAVHTGQIFKDLLGRYTWLVIPAGGMFLLISLLSGGYDWLYRQKKELRPFPIIS
ncbi:PepSY-associated TM region [Desulfocicer vacuolatum DSM 3385]|uniref:PepSY-associated TM region n=1 Tax=Desulfocicer vacuolatum DSM 3385 TaxID=1121400 RepID=A0A1W1YRP8_9BACT|nr:PepSY-associated TM helix domain-containing protein [Desulfocicer vacuolatum]SMC38829.1 PepSY-associated TM region [Desulfocicer vacuolatum DSM 3385]